MQALNDLIGRFEQNEFVTFLRLASADLPTADSKQYADGTKTLRAVDGGTIDPRNWTLLSVTAKGVDTHEENGTAHPGNTSLQAVGLTSRSAPGPRQTATASCMADCGPD